MVVRNQSGTTNLTSHIRRHHPNINLTRSTGAAGSSAQTLLFPERSLSQKQTETNKPTTVASSTIPQMFGSKYSSTSDRAKLITNKIARFLVKDLRPYSMVDSAEFKDMVRSLDPRYTVPGRKVFSEVVIPNMYSSTKELVKLSLRGAEQVALTTDGWSSRATESYMTITSSHITDQWELQTFVLQTRALPDSHTGEHVSEVLCEAVKEWDLPTIHGNPPLVTDNASNMVKAGQLFGSLHIGCYAHTLNIAVQKCLSVKRVSNLLAKIRRIVAFFHRSNIASNILKVKSQALKLPQHKLVIDVSTRWNSAFDMVARFLEMQVAVFATLRSNEVGRVSDVSISDDELVLAEDMIKVLKPLKDVTVMLCTEHSPTVSIIMPLQNQIVQKLVTHSANDSHAITEMKSLARKSLQSRYTEQQQVLSMCSALDARFKLLPFLSDDKRQDIFKKLELEAYNVNRVKRVKLEPVETPQPGATEPPLPNLPDNSVLKDDSGSTPMAGQGESAQEPAVKKAKLDTDGLETSKDSTSGASVKVKKESVLGCIFGDVYISAEEPAKSPHSLAESEVIKYRAEPSVPLDVSPLHWWRNNEQRFPILARVAKKYLCIPATSVPSERVFSTAGDILSAQRSRLKSKHVDTLIFLKKNMA